MSLRYAALGLLAKRPGSGYDLLRRFERSIGNFWAATQSQLYTELGRLERDGYIEVVDTGPRSRKVYSATDAGRADLADWISRPVIDTPPHNTKLLRAFLLTEVDDAVADRFFDTVVADAQARIDTLTAIREGLPHLENVSAFDRISIDHALRHSRTEIEWATAARETLAEERARRDGPPA
ncbi:PadR family transcriptional regulator [Tsukamurella ocularis]|uniref:PadR family transcriptional regulator n=1 Tax=Tsukamurella ocularis TaxID=1970234 RepID=UPI0039EFEFE8